MNMPGSMIGEASQKAMTAESGTPSASIAATKGMTWHEQKGESPPRSAAIRIIRPSRPVKAFESSVSAPLAFM